MQKKIQNDIQGKKKPTDNILSGVFTPDISGPTSIRSKLQKNNDIRDSRRSNLENDDIIKELEDYVKEKKNTGKYLEDISDFDAISQMQTQANSK